MIIPRDIAIIDEDVTQAVRGDPKQCPLARALRRAFPHLETEVAADGIHFRAFGLYALITIEPILARCINEYDQGGEWSVAGIRFSDGDGASNNRLYAPSRVLEEMALPVLTKPERVEA